MTGAWVLVTVLAAATAFGLYRRWSDGRMTDTAPRPVSAEAGPVHVGTPDVRHHGGEHLFPEQLGVELGERATLVQISSSFCQPCRATRLLLSDVSRTIPGVEHVELAAEDHMDLVRQLDVRRTPTVFVLDHYGAIRKRAVGLPRKSEVVAALGEVVSL